MFPGRWAGLAGADQCGAAEGGGEVKAQDRCLARDAHLGAGREGHSEHQAGAALCRAVLYAAGDRQARRHRRADGALSQDDLGYFFEVGEKKR